METFENELPHCPDCDQAFDPSELIDWRCPICNRLVWISAIVNGNRYILERIKAKDMKANKMVLLDGETQGSRVKKVEKKKIKIKISVRHHGVIKADPETFFNTVYGNWNFSD